MSLASEFTRAALRSEGCARGRGCCGRRVPSDKRTHPTARVLLPALATRRASRGTKRHDTATYLKKQVVPTLIGSLSQLALARPENPLVWLAQYLATESQQCESLRLLDGSVLRCSPTVKPISGSGLRAVSGLSPRSRGGTNGRAAGPATELVGDGMQWLGNRSKSSRVEKTRAATDVQRVFRGHIGRKRVRQRRRHRAATKIQARHRGAMGRQRVLRLQEQRLASATVPGRIRGLQLEVMRIEAELQEMDRLARQRSVLVVTATPPSCAPRQCLSPASRAQPQRPASRHLAAGASP